MDFSAATYANAILEGHASDSQRLEKFGDGLPIGLGVSCRTGRGLLSRGEIGDALSGLDINVRE